MSAVDRRRRLATAAVAGLWCTLSLAGCSSAPAQQAAGSPAATADAEIGTSQVTAYTARTVVVGGDDGRPAVRGVTADGATIVLDPVADGVSKLKPGSVMLLSRVAVRTVVSVHPGPSGTVVDTVPADLTDAVQDGRVDFSTSVDVTRSATVPYLDESDCPGRHDVAATRDDKADQLAACGLPVPPPGPSASAVAGTAGTPSPRPVSSPSPVAIAPHANLLAAPLAALATPPGQSGTFGPWTYNQDIGFQGGDLVTNLSATRSGSSRAKVTVAGRLSSFAVQGTIIITGCQSHVSVKLTKLHASVDVSWTALSAQGAFAANELFHPEQVSVLSIGRVGRLPLSLRIGTGLRSIEGLTGIGGSSRGSVHADVSGGIAYTVAAGVVSAQPTLTISASVGDTGMVTPGPSALLVSVQFPHIVLGVGVPQQMSDSQSVGPIIQGAVTYTGEVQTLATCLAAGASVTFSVTAVRSGAGGNASVGGASLAEKKSLTNRPHSPACDKTAAGLL